MDKIYFTVNGESYTLSGTDVNPTTSLNDYLRSHLQLHGTKSMCHEGGCGACIVAVSQTHPRTKEKHVFSVNSCLVNILSCHQWDILTVEGLGNRKDGYHPIQTRLASFNGTQCGYCSPGMVMNMYSLFEGSNQKLTMEAVENSFGGNLCRCTGYRPILDAFKSFATDVEPKLKSRILDLEDLHQMKCTHKCERRCSVVDEDWCVIDEKRNTLLSLAGLNSRWYKTYTLQDVFKVIAKEGENSYTVVAGNTGQGVFPRKTEPRVFIDISSIETLKDTMIDVNLVVGAGTSLTDLIQTLRDNSTNADFKYLEAFVEHLDLVAHVSVKNIGTIGGNLAMKHAHPEFPSDIFLLLETVQAYVGLVDQTLSETCLSMHDFLETDINNKVITVIKLPPFSKSNLVRSYKIMPRAQNSLAIVNAGFYFKVDDNNKIETARIVYSPILPNYLRATGTEQLLVGMDLFSEETLRGALSRLSEEIVPVDNPPLMSPQCRKAIALGLFYKAILSLCPRSQLNGRYVSGGARLERGVSQGTQTFDTDKTLWPLNKPVPKLEALTQCSGEVTYACDVNSPAREVHVALVMSTICLGEIVGFDASEALKLPGVVGFFTAKDIPGKNNFIPLNVPGFEVEEEILASKNVLYYGQPIALVAAVSKVLALQAAELVKVTYKESATKPVLSIEEALVAPDKDRRVRQDATVTATAKGNDTRHVLKGTFSMPGQYHFTMETQSCYVTNTSDGVHVRASTQWVDLVHVATAAMLAIDQNKVRVTVGRVGGAYGSKASRSSLLACACALVARRLNRPASLVLPLQHNMAALGKRQRCRADYEVGVNDAGVIQYLKLSYYSDVGFNFNDTTGPDVAGAVVGMYAAERWDIAGYSVLTDKPSNFWCRAPGTTEATAIVEYLMERIAFETKKDPIDVRLANIAPANMAVKDMIDTLKYDCKYEQRKAEIATFNANNAWKKKAIKLSHMTFSIAYGWNFAATVSVYHGDGTVTVAHSGIEMGQGINTKIAQVVAYTLNVPLAKVAVVGFDSVITPNAMASSGSITSDSVAYAAVKACNELLERLKPVKEEKKLTEWDDIVEAAYQKGVNLQTSFMESPLDAPQDYSILGVCACEVTLDVLTGQVQVDRADLLEDVGISISPEIDVGQIEGSFVMGLGLWLSEELKYAPSGRLLTDRTWTYHPPGAKDIPVDFRVNFLKNSPNTKGVLRSKATGEPALTMSFTAALALREAVVEARKEFGYNDTEWIFPDTPFNNDNILKAISPKIEYFKLK